MININFCDERNEKLSKKKKSKERKKKKRKKGVRCCCFVSFPAENSQGISRGQFRVRLR